MEPLFIPQLANRQDRTLEIVVDETIPEFETLTPVRGKIIIRHGGTYLDVSAQTETIITPSAIPVGTTVETDRVEMWTRINGIQHVLQMGPWGMGEFSPRALIHGKGTSKAKIARETEDTWRITAPRDAIARLWDYSDIQNPVDKGLYYFGFDVKFTKLK